MSRIQQIGQVNIVDIKIENVGERRDAFICVALNKFNINGLSRKEKFSLSNECYQYEVDRFFREIAAGKLEDMEKKQIVENKEMLQTTESPESPPSKIDGKSKTTAKAKTGVTKKTTKKSPEKPPLTQTMLHLRQSGPAADKLKNSINNLSKQGKETKNGGK